MRQLKQSAAGRGRRAGCRSQGRGGCFGSEPGDRTDNSSAVTTLQGTVKDLKANQASLATTVSDETSSIKKAIDSPSVMHYKGMGITPGGFAAAETVYRTKATGGDIPTAFSALPYEGADAYSLSEFYGSARQSRV